MTSWLPVALWRPAREDAVPLLAIVLLATLVALPQLLGYFHANPMLYVGDMATGVVPGILRGVPYIDPNNGYGTQALGVRAMLDWLEGTVPWWNPYSGVGLPLAAEYQPGAFSPVTLLLLLPNGPALQQLALGILSGLGTYGLLRQLGLGKRAATMGGIAYAFNGTLAWFAHASATPVPYLPWLLWGIERAWAKCALGLPGGWRLIAVSMALSLLSPFPETAYISGLLALAWTVLRGLQAEPSRRLDFARRIAAGGTVGILIAAPQVFAFLGYLLEADIGGHASEFAFAALDNPAWVPSLVAPYAYGPLFAYGGSWAPLTNIWGSLGGYTTLAMLVVALYGFMARRDGLAWMLLAWILLTLLKSFNLEPGLTLLNLVPGVTIAAFARYVQPSWELALVILAARGVDALARSLRPDPWAVRTAAALAAVVGLAALAYGTELWPLFRGRVGLRNAALASAAWALLTAALAVWLIHRASRTRAVGALVGLVAFDALFMFAIPTLSNPRGGEVNHAAIAYLQQNLGLQRFFTLGPIQPNYGAYFGIASINHNYLPVSRRWVRWAARNLDAEMGDGVSFDGHRATAARELRKNLDAYEWVGVKLVVTRAGHDPFAPREDASGDAREAQRVYADGHIDIYQLPNARPYFESLGGHCTIEPAGRLRATATCSAPDVLLRRELYFPGWQARVGGQDAPLSEHRELFQALQLPTGRSEVVYRYTPPHIEWAWLVALLAAGSLALSMRKGNPHSLRS